MRGEVSTSLWAVLSANAWQATQTMGTTISFWLWEQWSLSFRRLAWLNKITRREHWWALWEPRAHVLWAIRSGIGGEKIWQCQPHIGGGLTPNPFHLKRKLSFLIYSDLKNSTLWCRQSVIWGFQHATLILLSTQMKSGFGRFLIYCEPSTFNKKDEFWPRHPISSLK